MRLLCLLALTSIVFSSIATAELNHLTENQWVQPADDGTLVGRVVLPAEGGTSEAVEDATVAILGRDGEVLSSVEKTDSQGRFVIRGVKPGVYALTARADFVFACCAMHVLDSHLTLDREFPKEVEISAANIDYTTVNTAIIRYMPPNVKTAPFSIDDAEFNNLASQVTSDNGFRVAQVAGGLRGKLHRPGAQGAELADVGLTNVFIVKDGREVARAVTNEQGEFSINALSVGQYSLMAVGADGLGLMGFELVTEDEDAESASVTSDGKQFVGHRARHCCKQVSMQVAPPTCVSICQPVVIAQQPIETCGGCGKPHNQCGCGMPVDPCACDPALGVGTPLAGEFDPAFYGDAALGDPLMGGYGGGGYGGGGYGGGGGGYGGGGGGGGAGGFGAIAGLATIGGVIAAISTSDDDSSGVFVVPSPPATPSIP